MGILKKIFSIILRVGISVVLLIFLFHNVDRKSLFETIKQVDLPTLLFAYLFFLLAYILCLFRWRMLLRAVNIHLPLKRIIISFSGGVFFNLFLPSTVGGDFMRSLDLASYTKKPREVVATVLLDRLSGYIGLVLLALVSICFGWKLIRDASVLLSISLIAGLLIAILLVLFNNRIYSWINKFMRSPNAGRIRSIIRNLHQELHIFKLNKMVIIKNVTISIFVQCLTPVSFFIIARSLGIKIGLVYLFVFLPIISAITLLPISIGGLGLRDATTIFFFAKIGIAKNMAFAMSLLNFSFILVTGILGGLIYVFTIRHRRLQPDTQSSRS
jgi:glycosyltransferase 2 family protein